MRPPGHGSPSLTRTTVRARPSIPRTPAKTYDIAIAIIRMERPGTLEVTDWEGDDRCSGCTVLADRPDVSVSGTTGGDGMVRFADLPPGEYQITREHVASGTAYVHVHGGGVTTTSETLSPDASGFFYVRKQDDEAAALRLVRGKESVPLAIIPPHYTAHDFVLHVQQR